MAAGGFKTFTTGEVLTSADTNNFLMQGVLVFDDATARDAAITTPVEGQVVYLKDTNAVLSYDGSSYVAVGGGSPLTTKGDLYTFSTVDARLPVGTDGQILTADSSAATGLVFATPASGGGMTLLSTTTLTGASVTVSSISQDFESLYIEWQGVTQGANGTFDIQLNATNGGHFSNVLVSRATTVSNYNDNVIKLLNNTETPLANANNAGTVTVFNYASTTARKTYTHQAIFTVNSTGLVSSVFGGGAFNSASAVSSLKFNSTTGTTFSTGTLRIYGVK